LKKIVLTLGAKYYHKTPLMAVTRMQLILHIHQAQQFRQCMVSEDKETWRNRASTEAKKASITRKHKSSPTAKAAQRNATSKEDHKCVSMWISLTLATP
jgi:hypothetical protein